jgi:hypothetical protein
LRGVAVITAVGALGALLGDVVFWAVHGTSGFARDLAYGFWVASAVVLVLMFVGSTGAAWRRTAIRIPESWVFTSAAVALAVIGIAVDVVGSG